MTAHPSLHEFPRSLMDSRSPPLTPLSTPYDKSLKQLSYEFLGIRYELWRHAWLYWHRRILELFCDTWISAFLLFIWLWYNGSGDRSWRIWRTGRCDIRVWEPFMYIPLQGFMSRIHVCPFKQLTIAICLNSLTFGC